MTTPWNDTYKTNRGETAAIVKSDTKPIRTAPMSDDEFHAELARSRREIEARGGLLVDRSQLGATEKAEREAAHELRGMIERSKEAA